MPTNGPAALAGETPKSEPLLSSKTSRMIETALTIAFAAVAVLFISFLVVVTGLV